jgi:predicted ribosome-associated RNA-binding protein Tma20
VIIDGIYVTDADRIRLISQMEDDARAQETVEVVNHALTRTPVTAAGTSSSAIKLARDKGQQVKRIHYGSSKPRNGYFL